MKVLHDVTLINVSKKIVYHPTEKKGSNGHWTIMLKRMTIKVTFDTHVTPSQCSQYDRLIQSKSSLSQPQSLRDSVQIHQAQSMIDVLDNSKALG